jgi:hydrogenase expression/formation protein HypE
MSKGSLSVGKLDPATLKQLIFSHLGTRGSRVLLGPSIGEDATVIDFGDKALVIHSDPITGAVENIGWHAVNVCANDIATRGVRPLWILTVLLLPENFSLVQLKSITAQIDEAAKELGIAVVGGHSEVTPGIDRPIVVTTALGETLKAKFIRTSGAKVGDSVILTKGAAIEGTSILAHELESTLQEKVGKEVVARAKQFVKQLSVVKDALTAVEVGGVHAMHDATEGGVAGGLQEIAWASNAGLTAHEEKMIVSPETQAICKALGVDPLKTISSGTLIIAAESKKAQKIVKRLKQKGISASIVGKILAKDKGAFIIRKDGTKLDLAKPVREELWRVLQKE